MSRVTTKIVDLASLKKAKHELKEHVDQKKINIQLEVEHFKMGLLSKGDESRESLSDILGKGPLSKSITRLVVTNLIKPKSKLVSKISIYLGTLVLEKYGGNIQKSFGKWLNKPSKQKAINGSVEKI